MKKGQITHSFKRIIAFILINTLMTTLLPADFIDLSGLLGKLASANTGDYFREVDVKQGSDNGSSVGVLYSNTHEASDINMSFHSDSTEYYLVVNGTIPSGGGYLKLTLGTPSNDDNTEGTANGLVYGSNIPGGTDGLTPGYVFTGESTGGLNSVESYDNFTDPSSRSMKDGTLCWKLDTPASEGVGFGFTISFTLDESYWWNDYDISDALSLELCDSGKTSISKLSGNVIVSSNSKSYNFGLYTTSSKVRTGNTPSSTYARMTGDRPMLYDDIQYDITYPSSGVTINTKEITDKFKKAVIGDKVIDTQSGTITQHIILPAGYKSSGTYSLGNVNFTFDYDIYPVGSAIPIVFSGFSYSPSRGNSVTLTTKLTYTYNVIEKLSQVENVTMTRYSGSKFTSAEYNWNIGRENDDLLTTSMMMGAVNISNTGGRASGSKIYHAYFNTTNEAANITLVTLPIETDSSSKKVNVKWSGLDNNGQKQTGTTIIGQATSYAVGVLSIHNADLEAKGVVSLTEVEITIDRIPSAYASYTGNYIGARFFRSACWGYFTDGAVGNRIYSEYSLTDVATDESIYTQTYMDSTSSNQTCFNNSITVNSDTSDYNKNINIDAGSSVNLKVNINTITTLVAAGYSASSLIDPVLILALPKGFSYSDIQFTYNVKASLAEYNTESQNAAYSKVLSKSDYTIENISYMNHYTDTTPDDSTDDWKEDATLYKITFDNDIMLGYFDDYGNNGGLVMNINLGTDINMVSTNYKYCDMIQVMSEHNTTAIKVSSTGASKAVDDIYGINNGNRLAGAVSYNKENNGLWVNGKNTVIVNNSLCITRLDGVDIDTDKQEWTSYDESNPNSTAFLGLNSAGKYKVSLMNPSPSTATGIKLVVPMVKENTSLGTLFQSSDGEFNMNLSWDDSKVPDGFKIRYIKLDTSKGQFDTVQLDYSSFYNSLYNSDGSASYQVISSDNKESANAILIESDNTADGQIEAKSNIDFEFKFNIGDGINAEDADNGDFNLWRNCLIYESGAKELTFQGNYVSSEIATSIVKGKIFEDKDANGIYDSSDEGISGVTITLRDSAGRVLTGTSDTYGNYKVTQVRNDTVQVTMKLPSGVTYRFRTKSMNNLSDGIIGNQVTPSSDGMRASTIVENNTSVATVNAAVSEIYTVSYNANGGSSDATPLSVEYLEGESTTIERQPSAMLRTGYTFIGWSTDANPTDDTTIYQSGDSFVVKHNITLYAIWKVNTYHIKFDYQGCSITEPAGKTVVYGSTFGSIYDSDAGNFSWFTDTPVKDGYTFWHWELADADTPVGSGNVVASSTRVSITKDMIIRPVFVKVANNKQTLSLRLGDVSESDEPFIDLSSICAVENIVTDGYVNYNITSGTLPDGLVLSSDGKIYGAPSKSTGTDTEVKISVTVYNSSNTKCYTLSDDDGITLDLTVDALPVEFELTTQPRPGLVYDNSGTQEVNLQAVLSGVYSEWNVASDNSNYKVNFYQKLDGEIEQFISSVSTCDVSENKLTFNYTWIPSEIGNYTIRAEFVNLSDNYKGLTTASTTFKLAEAEIISHTISFDTCVNSIATPSAVSIIDQTPFGTAKLPVLTRSGYTFLGWFTSKTSEDQYNEEDPVTSDMTLYAHWSQKKYTVKYETAITGTTIADKNDITYTQTNLIPETAPSCYGYTFNKWILKGTSQTVNADCAYNTLVTSDNVTSITLSAQWTANTSKITYDYGSGTGYTTSKNVTYNTSLGTLTTGIRHGYTFAGWKQKLDDAGGLSSSFITENTVCDWEGNITLSACWIAKTYEIEYTLNGGTCDNQSTIDKQTAITWNTSGLLPQTTPLKDGYTFTGWFYGSIQVSDTNTYSELVSSDSISKIVLKAQWEKNPDAIAPEITGIYNGETRIVDSPVSVTVTDTNLSKVILYTGTDDTEGIMQSIDNNQTSNVTLDVPDSDEQYYKIYCIDIENNETTYSVTLIRATYDITINAPTFEPVIYGYDKPEAGTLAITSTGNSDVNISNISLEGQDASCFELNTNNINVIPSGDTDRTCTIQPQEGLETGTYTTTLTVKYNNDAVQRKPLTFVVNSKPVDSDGQIVGSVESINDSAHSIKVSLEVGNTAIASIDGLSSNDTFSFSDIPDGSYNLVATDGEHTITKIINIHGQSKINVGVLSIGCKQTRVEVSENALDIAVGGLNRLFENDLYKFNTEANDAVDNGGYVEIKMSSAVTTDENIKKEIKTNAANSGYDIGFYTDINLIMTISPKSGTPTTLAITDTESLMLIAVPLSADLLNKSHYKLYRNHNGQTQELDAIPADEMSDTAVEGYCVYGDYLYIWANKFSTYALSYKKQTAAPTDSPSSSPTDSSTNEPTTKPTDVPDTLTTSLPTDTPALIPQETPSPTTTPDDNEISAPSVSLADSLMSNVDKLITGSNTDKNDPKGSTFAKLQLKLTGGKKCEKLKWKKIKGVTGYVIYGSRCGKKMSKLKTLKGASKTKWTQKKLKKGKYYKYIVVAYKANNGVDLAVTISKSVHATTKGGKKGNPTKVKVKKRSVTIKKKKKFKIKASYKKKKKVSIHIAKFRYESTKPKIASVNKKGKIKAKKKGKTTIYVYSQNGLFKKIKVKVKK